MNVSVAEFLLRMSGYSETRGSTVSSHHERTTIAMLQILRYKCTGVLIKINKIKRETRIVITFTVFLARGRGFTCPRLPIRPYACFPTVIRSWIVAEALTHFSSISTCYIALRPSAPM